MTAFARATRPFPLQAVLFDLDGTLIDSAPDIAATVNELLAADGLAPYPLAAVRRMIGQGAGALVARAYAVRGIALSAEALASRHPAVGDIYGRRLTQLTTLTPGAANAVRTARTAGLACAVVTNKREGFARQILAHFGLLADFNTVIGGDSGFPMKPAPDMLLAACDRFGTSPQATVLVGDSDIDAASARAAGVTCILVRGGYGDHRVDDLGVDLVVTDLDELPAVLGLAERAAL